MFLASYRCVTRGLNVGIGVQGREIHIYTKGIMKVRNGSSGRVFGDLWGGKAPGRSCSAVSEVQIAGIPKQRPLKAASPT